MYSATVLEQFHHLPHSPGFLENPDTRGCAGTLGEAFSATVACLAVGRLPASSSTAYGCPSTIACASWLTRWMEGKTFEQAPVISAEDLMRVLGGLPLGKEHAAHLAVKSLRDALKQVVSENGA